MGVPDVLGFGVFVAAALFVWRLNADAKAVERARARRALRRQSGPVRYHGRRL
jgi:hypothetical protein